jgi:hypothetical protein
VELWFHLDGTARHNLATDIIAHFFYRFSSLVVGSLFFSAGVSGSLPPHRLSV